MKRIGLSLNKRIAVACCFIVATLSITSTCYAPDGGGGGAASGEQITITTYYPAPYGVYGTTQVGQVGHFQTMDYDAPDTCHRIYGSGDGTDRIELSHNGTTHDLVIAGDGRIGIGTESPEPNYRLHAISPNEDPGIAILGQQPTATNMGAGVYGVIGTKIYNLEEELNHLQTGILGTTDITNAYAGYFYSPNGIGVRGEGNTGVEGEGEFYGVKGTAICTETNSTKARYGVFGEAGNNVVPSSSSSVYGLYGKATNLTDTAAEGYGVYGEGDDYGGWFKGPTAGYFEGDVSVTGNLNVIGTISMVADSCEGGKLIYPETGGGLVPGDVAELVKCDTDVTLADVVSIDSSKNKFIKSTTQNDMAVAGIISENPTLAIGSKEMQEKNNPENNYQYIALAGQVYCKVDATYGEIHPGDLLTTSTTPGHAMKAKPIGEINGHPIYPQGCIVGKALEGLKEGKGKIPVLVCLM